MATIETSFYDVLGIARDADGATIKAAYRRAAMDCHPDRNGGCTDAAERFKALNEAHDVLKDPQKRAAYDRFGKAAFQNGGGAGAQADMGGFSDIFENIFGDFMGGRQQQRGGRTIHRGQDLRYDLELTLQEAFGGKEAKIEVSVSAACEPCAGSGATPGTSAKTCATCGGRGQVRAQQGFFVVERACPTCHGAGQTIADPCKVCRGIGRVERDKSLDVTIPRGVDDGTRIRLAGEGEAGLRGGPAGRLQARRDHAVRRGAARLHHSGAGRHTRRALSRRGRRKHQNPRRHATRQAVPRARQGHALASGRRHGRSGGAGGGRNPGQAIEAPARTARSLPRDRTGERFPQEYRLLRAVEGPARLRVLLVV